MVRAAWVRGRRLDGDHGLEYGTLPAGTDFSAIVERHTPAS